MEGPGNSLGLENSQIMVKYAGSYFRMHLFAYRMQRKQDIRKLVRLKANDNIENKYDNSITTNEMIQY